MGLLNRNINITGTNDLDPNFSWQVGFKNSESFNQQLQFRVTVRPLTNNEANSRIPNSTVLYEETGVLINNVDRLGAWEFPLSVNAALTGGPYRDYQVVIEAHDSQGNTSAGNRCGSQNEDGWTAYPEGFDVIAITNVRQTGIELSSNIPTQISGITRYFTAETNHASKQYLDANGNITINYTSGIFSSDLVGGFLYTSTIPFPKYEIFDTGDLFYYPRVQKTRFDNFDPTNPYIHIPTAAFDIRGAPFIYGSISFFDEIDKIILDNGNDISSQLYVSNNALFFNDSSAGSLSVAGITTLGAVQVTGYPSMGSYLTGLIGSGSIEIARTTTSGLANKPGNITTIFYMSRPMTGLNYTGFAGGNIANTYGGIGGQSINNVDSIPYGGFLSGTKVAVGVNAFFQTDQYVDISTLSVGSNVVGWYYRYDAGFSNTDGEVYNYTGDNWRSSSNKYPVSQVSWVSGTVTKKEIINVDNYYRMTFTGTIGKYIYLDVSENQVLTVTNNGMDLNSSFYPTGYFFRRAKDITTGLTLATDIPNSYRFSGKQLINNSTQLYCINVSPYNTFQISGGGNPYAGYDIRPTYVHDSVFSLKTIYSY